MPAKLLGDWSASLTQLADIVVMSGRRGLVVADRGGSTAATPPSHDAGNNHTLFRRERWIQVVILHHTLNPNEPEQGAERNGSMRREARPGRVVPFTTLPATMGFIPVGKHQTIVEGAAAG